MSYGKKKYGCLKYIVIFLAIVLLTCYTLAKISPKAFESAKNEAIERVFGVTVEDSTKAATRNDSIVVIAPPKVQVEKDTSLVVIPVKVTDHSAHVMVKINGIDVIFTIDTGCSDMQITSAEFFYMKHLGLISEADVVDNVTCVYADNSSNECPVVNLKTVNIGGIELKNIKCTIQENADSSLLLGQNVLKQLGEISIDYTKGELKIKR